MKFNAVLVEKTSKKGNTYLCIEVAITDKIKKVVFLDQAEIELIKLAYANSNANK